MNKNFFIDLFCGAGGMSCGLEMSGFTCLMGIDSDKYAVDTFGRNHRSAIPICSSIEKITTESIKEIVGDRSIKLICGGPPCQGFSCLGKGDPSDERNFLFLEFLRIVEAINPEYVLIENVVGLMAKKNQNTVLSIIYSLEQLGYSVNVEILKAHHYGVPQKRRRVFFLANRVHKNNNFPKIQFNDEDDLLPNYNTVQYAWDNWLTDGYHCYNHDLIAAAKMSEIDIQRLSYIPEGKGIRYQKEMREYLPEKLWYNVDWLTIRESRLREYRLQRLNSNICSPTISSQSTYYHPTENRRLTQREVAAIQSFPASYIFSGSNTQQRKQIGNAVPPLLAKAIGEAILQNDQQPSVSITTQRKSADFVDHIHRLRSVAFAY
ncbi:DNA cytosine methyltransferase [Arthrospira platensis SPKY1]|nr:DNA cytosine methyltransferase [Arthrospira platensis SPKY1]